MQERVFGRTGRRVTAIGLGAWPIGQKEQRDGSMEGGYGRVPPDVAQATVERYVELGGTFIDTARNYGTSEAVIGRCSFMKSSRNRIFLATKSGSTSSLEQLPQIETDLETSLRNLRTDYVDLFQIHSPPDEPDLMSRVIEIFLRQKERGLVRAIGASVTGPDVTPQTVELAKRYVDTGEIDALQLIYSIFRRRHEETFRHAYKRGVAIIARTVMESGFLTGTYRPGATFGGHRARWGADRSRRLLEEASRLAESIEPPFQTLAQVAQRFALERPEVSVIIPGAKSVAQVEANVAVDALPPLSGRMLQSIEALPPAIAELANTGD